MPTVTEMLQIAAIGLVLTPLAGAVGAACDPAPGRLRLCSAAAAAGTWLCSAVLLLLTWAVSAAVSWDVVGWIALGDDTNVAAGFLIDPLAAIVAFVIASTHLAIHVYATAVEEVDGDGTTAGGRRQGRQEAITHFGVFSALLAVTANNYGMLYVGWEGVALSTWLLVRLRGDTGAATRTLLYQGVSSLGLLTALAYMLLQVGSVAYADILGASGSPPIGGVVGLSLVAAAVARGGLWPLHPWLERSAMATAPTAALIQTAFTVPTAGYLLIRSQPLLFQGDGLQEVGAAALLLPGLGLVGSALLAACALAAFDPRRALAYSTSSQGAMTLTAVALGLPGVALLQLAIHACAKCLLLLATGLIERANAAGLDLARLGGLRTHLPAAFWSFLVGATVSVLPPFAGFWAQVSILHSASALYAPLVAVGGVSALLTSMYLFRLLFRMFTGLNPNTVLREGTTTTPAVVSAGLLGLVAAALAISQQAIPFRLADAIANPFAAVGALPSSAQATSQLGLGGAILVVLGCGWSWLNARGIKPGAAMSASPTPLLRHLLANGLLFDRLYTLGIARPLRRVADMVGTLVDAVFVELLCTRATGIGVRAVGWLLGTFHDGRFAPAATAVVLTAAMVLAVVILWARP